MGIDKPLRVLIIHNRYLHAGGEDAVVASEAGLLQSNGTEIQMYERDNRDVATMGRFSLLAQTIWSGRTTRDMERKLTSFMPDVVHIHNSFPLISGSVYWACATHGVPVIQTIHIFRLLCLQAMFLRGGVICEDCLGRSSWRGAIRGCYQGSRATSAVAGAALQFHRAIGTYQKHVSRYIALNEFCKAKLVEGGLPSQKICIKPNFVAPMPMGPEERTGSALFVGRLSEEKGLNVLMEAAKQIPAITVDIVGSGPQEQTLQRAQGFRLHGARPAEEVYDLLRRAPFLVMPSVWYENMPRTLIEAYACGTPVIASRLGALADLVKDGSTGLLFEPGSGQDLANKIHWALGHPDEMQRMGLAARQAYEDHYAPESNYRTLMAIYNEAIGSKTARPQ